MGQCAGRLPGLVTLKSAIGVREIFEEHADFVWRVLARAGVRDADLKDALQEVFIVVANKLGQLDESTKPTTVMSCNGSDTSRRYSRAASFPLPTSNT